VSQWPVWRCKPHCSRKIGRRSSGPIETGFYTGPEIVPSFPAHRPAVALETAMSAPGFAGPAVVGDRLVLFHRVNNRETVEAMDANERQDQLDLRLRHVLSR
jgi:hypothetical protein